MSDFTPTVCPWLSTDRQRELVDTLRRYGVKEFSHRGLRCLDLLIRLYRGAHHIPRGLDTYDWTLKKHGLQVLWSSRGATMSSTDFDELTRLVFLAHDLCIRVEVGARGMYGCLWLCPREASDLAVGVWEAHPTLEKAYALWRGRANAGPVTLGPPAYIRVVASDDPKWPVGSYVRALDGGGSPVQLFESTTEEGSEGTRFPVSVARAHRGRISLRPGTLKVELQVVTLPLDPPAPHPAPVRLGAVRVVKGGAGWVEGSWVRRAEGPPARPLFHPDGLSPGARCRWGCTLRRGSRRGGRSRGGSPGAGCGWGGSPRRPQANPRGCPCAHRARRGPREGRRR